MSLLQFREIDAKRHDDLAWERVKLSVVIPAYNEIKTVEKLLRRVREVRLDVEVIVVDDGSTDGTSDLLQRLTKEGLVDVLVFQEVNQGKGAGTACGMREGHGRHHRHSGRGSRVRSSRDTHAHGAHPGR